MGRVFEPRDAGRRQPDTVILSHGFWQRRFGGATDILGRSVRLDERSYTVIGVMPSAFAFPDRETQAWIPAYIAPVYSEGGDRISLQIFGAIARMRPGVTAAQVAAEGTARARAARDPGTTALALFGSGEPPTITAMPALEVAVADVRPAIRVMLAAVAPALRHGDCQCRRRAACTGRQAAARDGPAFGTRREHGPPRAPVAHGKRVVGVAGGLLGMAGARLLVGLLPAILPADFPRLADITLDWRVGLAATAATLAAIVACALFPAMQARRLDLTRSLADDGAAPVGAGMRTPAARLRSAIMAGQVGVACVLLIGAGAARPQPPGADQRRPWLRSRESRDRPPSAAFGADVRHQRGDVRGNQGADAGAARRHSRRIRQRAAARVRRRHDGPQRAPAARSGTAAKIQALHRTVDPDYFGAMGLRLRAGRLLSDSDTATSQPVLVVNKSFADQYLGEDPVGRRLALSLYRKAEWEIVGVVEDMKQGGLQTGGFVATTDAAQPEMFSSYRQFGEMRVESVFFLARAHSDPSHLVPSIRTLVREQAPALVLDSVMTMEERVMASLSRPRAYALVVGVMAAFALAIACVGLFGVLSYSVAQRTREIGVRTALGARTADVVALVLRSGLAIVATGLAGGLAAAGLLVQSLSKILYGVRPFDPVTFAIVPLFLVLAAAVACVAPARRAARIDPLRALRGD